MRIQRITTQNSLSKMLILCCASMVMSFYSQAVSAIDVYDLHPLNNKNIIKPQFGNKPLNHCYLNGHGCGIRTANAYCRRQGYQRASFFIVDKQYEPTRYLANGKVCRYGNCRSFGEIRCSGYHHRPRYNKTHHIWLHPRG